MDSRNRLRARASAIYVIVAFLGVLLIHEYVVGPLLEPAREVPYSQFRQDLAEQRVAELTVEPERIVYTLKASSGGNEAGRTTLQAMRIDDGDLVAALVASGAEFEARPAQTGLLGPILGWILPILPFALLWWLLMKRMGGGSGGILSVGKSKATEITGEMTGVSFADVAGVDQVEEELKEIIEFLKEPARSPSSAPSCRRESSSWAPESVPHEVRVVFCCVSVNFASPVRQLRLTFRFSGGA